MPRDQSVHKSGLLKKFLNDLNQIDYTKSTVKTGRNLRYEKSKPFALPMRPNYFNRKYITQLNGDGRSVPKRHPKSAAAFQPPESNILDPEVNKLFGNRPIRNRISFTNVQTATAPKPADMECEEIPSEINFQDILTSTRIDEQQDLNDMQYEPAIRPRYTNQHYNPVGRKTKYDYATDYTSTKVGRPKTIYDYATECTLTEVIRPKTLLDRCSHFDKPTEASITPSLLYETLAKPNSTTFVDKQQSTVFELECIRKEEFLWVIPKMAGQKQTGKPIQLEKNNHYSKIDMLDRCSEFNKPIHASSTTSLLYETPSKPNSTMFVNNQQSTVFELECIRKQEFLWVNPKTAGKKNAAKPFPPEKINQYRKLHILDRCPRFDKPTHASTTPSLLYETPCKPNSKIFMNQQKSSVFELECIRKEEFLWISSKPTGEKQTAKSIPPPQMPFDNNGNNTFFEMPDIDSQFLKCFSIK